MTRMQRMALAVLFGMAGLVGVTRGIPAHHFGSLTGQSHMIAEEVGPPFPK